ncbi:von Willebrand factor A, partial [Catenovulum maritimum]
MSSNDVVTEAGGNITYTATLNTAIDQDLLIELSNGQNITINAGELTASVDFVVDANEDSILDAQELSTSITQATTDSSVNVVVDSTPVITQITDTLDTTELSLSATDSLEEAGGTITYTATLTNAADTDVTITLANEQTITIAAGQTQGSVEFNVAADEDAIVDATSITNSIASATGGNFENLVVDQTTVTTAITDTVDATGLSLSAIDSLTEAGGTITYTATLTNAADTDVTITLANEQTITIAAGQTQGSVDLVVAADEDAIVDATSITNSIASATGGNFENLVVDQTTVTTAITDTQTDTNLTLDATSALAIEGGTITYTASVNQLSDAPLTVNLSNGQSIVIAAGSLTGTVDVNAADLDGVSEISARINDVSGGNYENLIIDETPAVTEIAQAVTLLAATDSLTEAGGAIVYTAELSAVPESDVTITLSNGETITILAGETSASVNVEFANSDDVYIDESTISANITDATGGGFVSLGFNDAPAVTRITDTVDTTELSLSATDSLEETGGTITYTATLTNAADTDVTITLANEQTITIAAGQTQGSVDLVVAADEDAIVDAGSISNSIASATGG